MSILLLPEIRLLSNRIQALKIVLGKPSLGMLSLERMTVACAHTYRVIAARPMLLAHSPTAAIGIEAKSELKRGIL